MSKATANDSLEVVARLLDLVPYLSTHQGISIVELAETFSISVDQMTKDLTTLWMCGLPGYTAYELIDLSFESGFVTIANAETLERPRALNRDEVLALLLGLESLREELGDSSPEVKEMVLQTISRLTELIGSIASRSIQLGDGADSKIFALIENAIANRVAVEIKYHSVARDEISTRILNPFNISTDERNAYLYAYCETSGENRTFRMDRIVSAENLPEVNSEQRQRGATHGTGIIEASLEVSARKRDIAERFNLDLSSMEQGKKILLRCFSGEWAVREIMSFSGAAQVKAPAELRNEIALRSKKALAAYL